MDIIRTTFISNCPYYDDSFFEWILLYSRFAVLQIQFFLYGISIIYGDTHTLIFGIACTIDTLIIFIFSKFVSFKNYFVNCNNEYLFPSFISQHFSFFVFSILIHVCINNVKIKLKPTLFILIWYYFTMYGEITISMNNIANIVISVSFGIILSLLFQFINYTLFSHYHEKKKIKKNDNN